MTAATVLVRVPRRFYDDHVSRDLPGGRVVKELRDAYRVELDPAAYADLLSDASYYVAGGTAEFGPDYIGLISSARATVAALAKVEPPAEVEPETTTGPATDAERARAYRARKRGGPARELAPCGTYAAAKRHARNGEALDEPCRVALAEQQAAQYAKRRGAGPR